MLGLPFGHLAHGFCLLTSCFLAVTGFAGFVLTGMKLDFNGGSLVVLAWATAGIGALSARIDAQLLSKLYRTNQPDHTESFNIRHTKKKLTLLGGISVNLGLVAMFTLGILAADSIAAGTKHTVMHPGGTKLIATICVFAKLCTVIVDFQLLRTEMERQRRFETLLQEDQDPEYQDEPLGAYISGAAGNLSGDRTENV